MIWEWQDGAVEVRYKNERMEYEDLVLRPRGARHQRQGRAAGLPSTEVASSPEPSVREGHEERRKQLLLD